MPHVSLPFFTIIHLKSEIAIITDISKIMCNAIIFACKRIHGMTATVRMTNLHKKYTIWTQFQENRSDKKLGQINIECMYSKWDYMPQIKKKTLHEELDSTWRKDDKYFPWTYLAYPCKIPREQFCEFAGLFGDDSENNAVGFNALQLLQRSEAVPDV